MDSQIKTQSNELCFYPRAEVQTALGSIFDSRLKLLPKNICSEIFKAVLNLNEASIASSSLLGKYEKQLPKCVKETFTDLRISLLHLATLKGSETLVENVCEMGASPNARDATGNSALHFAAMTANKRLFDHFPNLCPKINVEARNDIGAKPEDYFDFVQGSTIREGSVYQRFEKAVELDPRCFVNGVKPSFKFLIGPKYLLSFWSQSVLYQDQVPDYMQSKGYLKRVSATLKSPPQLEVKFINKDVGCGLFAREDIKQGDFLTPYFGKCLDSREIGKTLNQYHTSFGVSGAVVDSFKDRGIGALANDGPPNAVITMVQNQLGLTDHPELMAINKIKKGEQILLNYGEQHPINGQHDVILFNDSTFFQDFNLEKLIEDINLYKEKTRFWNPEFYNSDSGYRIFMNCFKAREAITSVMVRPLIFIELLELGKLNRADLETIAIVSEREAGYLTAFIQPYYAVYTGIFDVAGSLPNSVGLKELYLNAFKDAQKAAVLNGPQSESTFNNLISWAKNFLLINEQIKRYVHESVTSSPKKAN